MEGRLERAKKGIGGKTVKKGKNAYNRNKKEFRYRIEKVLCGKEEKEWKQLRKKIQAILEGQKGKKGKMKISWWDLEYKEFKRRIRR